MRLGKSLGCIVEGDDRWQSDQLQFPIEYRPVVFLELYDKMILENLDFLAGFGLGAGIHVILIMLQEFLVSTEAKRYRLFLDGTKGTVGSVQIFANLSDRKRATEEW